MKWDKYFLEIAKQVSTASKDPSTKTGAVLVDLNRVILSTGYNGFPRRVHDDADRYANRELKLKMVVHAEINALLLAEPSRRVGGSLFVFPWMPCAPCAAAIIQAGVAEVVTIPTDEARTQRWKSDFNLTELMFAEAGVLLRVVNP